MVRVEAPPHTVASEPPPARPFPWLVVFAGALLASAPLPWERWCSGDAGDSGDPLGRCFSAALWGGSASLAGLLLVVLTGVLLVVSLRRPADPGRARTVLVAAILAILGVKLVIATGNLAAAAESNTLVSGFPVGFWVGLAIGFFGCIGLLASMDFAPSHRRRNLLHLGVVVAIVAVSVPYAMSGLAWWGGPLAEPAQLGGGNGAGHVARPGQPMLFDSLLYLRDLGDVSGMLDGLDLVDPSGRIHVIGTYVMDGAKPCGPGAVQLPVRTYGACAYPLRGFRVEPGGPGDGVRLAMLLDVPRPGVYRSSWFRIRYHVGPLRFEIFRTDHLVICSPEPGRERCPGGFGL